MTVFPTWTGPEACKRLNAEHGPLDKDWHWPEHKTSPVVRAFQQLMVDAGPPEPVDEAEALYDALWQKTTRAEDITLIREALAKARGKRG